ncbi:MAG: signal peptidase II, partial [Nanoarchaeota archaeon]|nr:signal peptidase II [Nanoarchaeota archaeon]
KKNNLQYFLIIDLILIFFFFFFYLINKYFFTNKSYFDGNFIYILFSKNTGSAFSMFSDIVNYNLFIIILSIIVLLLMFWNYKYFISDFYLRFTFVLFLSGVLGNLYDRIFFSYVRDFIGVKYFSIFNLADSYLTLAFVFYLLYEWKYKSKNRKNKSKIGKFRWKK